MATSVVTRPTFEKAVSAITSSNPDVSADEARRVLAALSGLASAGKLPGAFFEFVASGRGIPVAGYNACDGGNNESLSPVDESYVPKRKEDIQCVVATTEPPTHFSS